MELLRGILPSHSFCGERVVGTRAGRDRQDTPSGLRKSRKDRGEADRSRVSPQPLTTAWTPNSKATQAGSA